MPIPTSRTSETAEVILDESKCNNCGVCIKVCKGQPLVMIDGKLHVDQSHWFGCIACGQCAAICPHSAIAISGRDFSPDDIIEMPAKSEIASFDQLLSLMRKRRSIRDFKDKPVPKELIDQILEAASSAPMGIPPTDVHVLCVNGKEKVREFSWDMIDVAQSVKWFFNPAVQFFMRPFMSKADSAIMKEFLGVIAGIFISKRAEGEDFLLYGAPAVCYFYGTEYSDPGDAYIAATYAMLAAEAAGLGSCMIGTVPYFMRYGKKLRTKYNIPKNHRMGVAVLLGYPAVKFAKAIKRRFAGINYIS